MKRILPVYEDSSEVEGYDSHREVAGTSRRVSFPSPGVWSDYQHNNKNSNFSVKKCKNTKKVKYRDALMNKYSQVEPTSAPTPSSPISLY